MKNDFFSDKKMIIELKFLALNYQILHAYSQTCNLQVESYQSFLKEMM